MKEGWGYKKLNELCEVITKGTTPTTLGYTFSEVGINFIKIESISTNRKLLRDKLNHISEECNKSMSRSQLQESDLLFSIAGALGRIYIVEKSVLPANTNQALAIIRLKNKQDLFLRYLSYYLSSNTLKRQIDKDKVGVAQLNLSLSQIKNFVIPIPSIKVQQHIVEELDLLSSIIEKKKAQLNELDNLAQSLFYEMFGDPITNDKGWEIKKLGEVCEIVRGGSPRPIDKFLGGNIPWIKIGDATKGDDIYLYSTKEHIIEEGLRKTRYIPKGSLIFANCGVSLGFARIIQFDGCIHDGWLALMNISENKLNKVFLLKSLNFCTTYFRNLAPDGTQPNLNTSIMKLHKQIIPPIIFQDTYVERLGQIEHQKTLIQKSIEQVETLFNSRMDYYFN